MDYPTVFHFQDQYLLNIRMHTHMKISDYLLYSNSLTLQYQYSKTTQALNIDSSSIECRQHKR